MELADLKELIPDSVLRQYESVPNPEGSVGQIHLPNLEPEARTVGGQLDALLGLPVDAPLVRVPRPELPLPNKTAGQTTPPESQATIPATHIDDSPNNPTASNAQLLACDPTVPATKDEPRAVKQQVQSEPGSLPIPKTNRTPPSEHVEKCVAAAKKLSAIAGRLTLKGCSVIRKVIGDSVEPGSFFSNKSEEEHRREWFDACAVKGEQSRID